MNWTINQNYLHSLEGHSTKQCKLVKCQHLYKRLERVWAIAQAIGNQTMQRSMMSSSVNQWLNQQGQSGVLIVKHIAQKEATSTLRTRNHLVLMDRIHVKNWMEKLIGHKMSIMNLLWAQPKQRLTFQAIMDSFQRLTSTHQQCSSRSWLETETPSSNRTWLKTIKWSYQATQATSQWTQ